MRAREVGFIFGGVSRIASPAMIVLARNFLEHRRQLACDLIDEREVAVAVLKMQIGVCTERIPEHLGCAGDGVQLCYEIFVAKQQAHALQHAKDAAWWRGFP